MKVSIEKQVAAADAMLDRIAELAPEAHANEIRDLAEAWAAIAESKAKARTAEPTGRARMVR